MTGDWQPNILLFELRFRVISPIRKLPHFHGAQWSAFFRHALRPCLPEGQSMAQAGISCIPVETGIETYESGEPAHVGLTFPASLFESICRALAAMNHVVPGDGHFLPGKTVLLETARDRISGKAFTFDDLARIASGKSNAEAHPLTESVIEPEIEHLAGLSRFRIIFYTPLRLNRPRGCKTSRHAFCDEDYFSNPPENIAPLCHLLAGAGRIRGGVPETQSPNPAGELTVADQALLWLDIPYQGRLDRPQTEKRISATTLGGVTGTLHIAGTPDARAARRLVLGQYTGVGKNHAFGLGFYTIPELDGVRKIRPPVRGKTLLDRCLTPEALDAALDKTASSSSGPDGISFADLKKAGRPYLENLRKSVLDNTHRPGGYKSYRMPKAGGGFREIHINNAADRLLHKAVADGISPVIDNLLSKSSFAYRLGLNRKGAALTLRKHIAEGFTSGVKADIAAFFDTVQLDRLAALLNGLFPFDPLPQTIIAWLAATCAEGRAALPQGSPLSPVISNLYLHRFDADMSREGFKLVRYADDFVCLFGPEASQAYGLEKIEASLYRLGLALKPEKTIPVRPGLPVDFLGYAITADNIAENQKEEPPGDQAWLPVFRETWLSGTPVYLSTICRGAYSSGANLVIKDDRDRTQTIPWNAVSRLIIVGRSPFSGGVVYRAARENIPVNFVDVRGRLVGSLYPDGYEQPEISILQEDRSKNPDFCLDFARRIIGAKIQNSLVLLRRNKTDLPALKELLAKVAQADSMDTLRGYEGYGAKLYFGEMAKLVLPFEFKGRVYHPPDSPVNVMLSFGYTLLYQRVALALKEKGFNPRLGFFHQGRGTHLALASDMLEELRHIAERVMLALIHTGEIRPEHFSSGLKGQSHYCRLEGEGFRRFIRRFERVMAGVFTVETGEKFTYNAYLDEMADHLRRCVKMGIPYKPLRIS